MAKYKDYLKSEHWKRFRSVAIEHVGEKCERCGLLRALSHWLYGCDLQVHHRVYRRGAASVLFAEQLSDVEVLCPGCHESVEQSKFDTPHIKELWEHPKVVFSGWPAKEFVCPCCGEDVGVEHNGGRGIPPHHSIDPRRCPENEVLDHLEILLRRVIGG